MNKESDMKLTGFKKLLFGAVAGLGLAAMSASAAPANDNFASATVISGATVSVNGSNATATREGTDPLTIDYQGSTTDTGIPTVWYRWTAPSSGQFVINTAGSSFDTRSCRASN